MIFAIKGAFATALLFIFVFVPLNEVNSSPESDAIDEWAIRFGDELWELGETMTKAKEIKQRYKSFNARVEKKDGETLIESIVDSIGRMLIRRMDAAKCIVRRAEEYAESFHRNESLSQNFTYFSSKYSLINNKIMTSDYPYNDNINDVLDNYSPMFFNRDSHFYNLEVNTSYSSVHVPTNVYEFHPEEAEFIQWSQILDEVFTQNYNSDPALSWQYFGSNLGIMRHYPAMSWIRNETDTYDCRKRSWYIETATCSKDVVILLDNSGSMYGFRNYVARLTIKSLLDTFSNNDFVNILTFTNDTETLVPCFENMLVQATPENIEVFNRAVELLAPEAYAHSTSTPFRMAFELLDKYREIRNCSGSKSGCNQAIMLVTDGVPANETEVFEKYNRVGNGTVSPVRVFTYLLGQEVTKVKEIKEYACKNRGFHSHVPTLDKVAEEVLKYVNVIAAPLVLQKDDHPPTWTHAYLDQTYKTDREQMDDDKRDFRMMIAVGVPAFNLSSYGEGNYTGRPTLLGVAGTDVPIDDIIKLALPYKLGVNGYSFVVSNNGYVLLHPDLRPYDEEFGEETKENYNSVDITEIEQTDDSLPPRNISEDLINLRYNLVMNKKGRMLGIPVKFHYDERRRVEKSKQDFYFAPIPYTPFSLGIALPHEYGNTWIKVGDEIQRNNYTKVNISDFFVGENWKVHPEWVYCKYHYKEFHEFKDNEGELREFLRKIVEPGWKWLVQYEVDDDLNQDKDIDDVNCGRKSFGNDAYYCNKELVELLVFDAKVTNESYQSWTFKNEREREIIEKYNATVRYVSTMSGLTRWQFIFGEVEVEGDTEFGDDNRRAIEEPWYKNAILQHQIDKESFVYTVPRKQKQKENEDIQVSASMAIFPRDGGLEAPSCVVGFQFSHQLMEERFMEITSNSKCDDCIKTCSSEEQYCYVIDNNGYVIISVKDNNDTGMFFGEIEKPTMQSMVDKDIFKKVVVYDFQGLCERLKEKKNPNAGRSLMTPFKFLYLTFKWIIVETFVELSRMKFLSWGSPVDEVSYEEVEGISDDDSDEPEIVVKKVETTTAKTETTSSSNIEEWEEDTWLRHQKERKTEFEPFYIPCDKKSELYVLQQNYSFSDRSYSDSGLRTFFVSQIPNSNLLLIVINKINEPARELNTVNVAMTTDAIEMVTETTYGEVHPCHKRYMNFFERRRIDECFTEHEDEEHDKVKYCGSSNRIKYTLSLILLPMFNLMRFA